MKRRWTIAGLIALMMMLTFGGSVFAFSDIQGDSNEAEIRALHKAGVVSGIAHELFAPKGKVTMAQTVVMLVKGFDLNIDHMKFIKEPKASDYFTTISDDAWYANAFMVAQLNGVPLAKDVDPAQTLTREQFADLLFKTMITRGDYAFINLWIILKDEDKVDQDYMNSIQPLVISKIADLEDGYFHPKRDITRGEAAKMLHKAIQFVKKQAEKPPVPPVDTNASMTVSKVNDEVNKVTISLGEKPNPGYRAVVTHIAFTADGQAIISYDLLEPEPGKMYPQVITEAKAETFVSSQYKPVLAGHYKPDLGQSSSPAFDARSSSTKNSADEGRSR